jgi:hypothetical protein
MYRASKHEEQGNGADQAVGQNEVDKERPVFMAEEQTSEGIASASPSLPLSCLEHSSRSAE